MVKLRFCAVSALLLSSFVSLSSYAVECDTPRLSRAFNIGKISGAHLVGNAWASVNSCDQLDKFEAIVQSTLQNYRVPPESSTYVVCRYTGVVEGAVEKLDEIIVSCTGI